MILVESEYPDGRAAWFENRLLEDPGNPWVEHPLECPLNFCHSLAAWRDPASGEVRVFVAEMAQGGWNPRGECPPMCNSVLTAAVVYPWRASMTGNQVAWSGGFSVGLKEITPVLVPICPLNTAV